MIVNVWEVRGGNALAVGNGGWITVLGRCAYGCWANMNVSCLGIILILGDQAGLSILCHFV